MALKTSTGFVLVGSSSLLLHGVSDLLVVQVGGMPYLIVGSEAHGAVTSFALSGTGVAVKASQVLHTTVSGTQALSDLTLVNGLSGPELLTLGRYDDNFGLYDIGSGGALAQNVPLPGTGAVIDRGYVGASAVVGTTTHFYSASFGVAGLNAYRVETDGSLTLTRTLTDTAGRQFGDVTAIEVAALHGLDFLVVGSAIDVGLHILSIAPNGRLAFLDRHKPSDGDGMFGITDIAAAQPEDRAFVIVASSETDSLTVLRVSQAGMLNQVDHVTDTRLTRFGGVSDIEVLTHAGRTFVLAGGGDDGITIFELTYRGQLQHLVSIADDFGITLENVSAIDVRLVAGQAHVYVGSSSEHGVTELVFDAERSGSDIRGGATSDILYGTAGDDVLWGMGHGDALFGGAGDDRLIDGRGSDRLTGGAGADVFEFVADGKTDFILDFEFGIDRIDLSAWDHLYHISSLVIGPRLLGGAILVGDDIIRLVNPDGVPFDMSLLSQDDFIFG